MNFKKEGGKERGNLLLATKLSLEKGERDLLGMGPRGIILIT